ncbi:MAG: hypothetical protein ACRDT0_21300, partial [Pseudonocardiaceae bacterium]
LTSSRGGSSTQTTVVLITPTVTLTMPLADCSSSQLHGVLNNVQTVRARYLGELPQNRELASKVLRALSASTMLALLYAIVFADTLARIVTATPEEARNVVVPQPQRRRGSR